jgi:hypothetical protein
MELGRLIAGQNDFDSVAFSHTDDIGGRRHLAMLDRDSELSRL